MKFRLSLINYAEKHGVSKIAIKYKTTVSIFTAGNAVTMTQLRLLVTAHSDLIIIRPSIHQKIKLIRDMRRSNPHVGLVVFGVKLMQRGYSRSIIGLWRVIK